MVKRSMEVVGMSVIIEDIPPGGTMAVAARTVEKITLEMAAEEGIPMRVIGLKAVIEAAMKEKMETTGMGLGLHFQPPRLRMSLHLTNQKSQRTILTTMSHWHSASLLRFQPNELFESRFAKKGIRGGRNVQQEDQENHGHGKALYVLQVLAIPNISKLPCQALEKLHFTHHTPQSASAHRLCLVLRLDLSPSRTFRRNS